ncbi:phosphopantetheine-binding protein [Streptomyces megasporus]|uniref:phosphopantetheine-binding protein n=1 Tax=Streptomyces megasporus TaxID=44060 RepID=UPI0004E1F545|nr:phosphopantetheine-binding protein [Streptomyces megasporus]
MNDQSATQHVASTSDALDVAAVTETVLEVWADVLEVERETIDPETSDFFDLGGYSLLALQAIGRVLAAHGVDQDEALEIEGLLLNQLFETPTAAAQVSCLIANLPR